MDHKSLLSESITWQLSTFVAEGDLSGIPVKTLSRATQHLLDTAGVALAAHSDARAKSAVELARLFGSSGVRVWGTPVSCSLPGAVLVNACLAHLLDYDDWDPLGGHPSCTVASAALSVAEEQHATGRSVLEAYILGVEVLARVTQVCPNSRVRGWHGTALFGAIGAAAASARLLRLNPQQTAVALGLAGTLACGLVRQIGTSAKAFQVGHSAHSGVIAAMLAQRGFDGEPRIFDGRGSFFDVYFGPENYEAERMTQSLGKDWHIVSPGVGLKPYPCSFPQFWAACGILALMEEHRLTAADVARVEVRVSPVQFKEHNIPAPESGLEAKFSLNFVSAASLLEQRLTRDLFTDEYVRDARIKETLRKIVILPDNEISGDWKSTHNVVRLLLRGGGEVTRRVDYPLGHPKNPMSDGQIIEKFRDNARVLFDETKTHQILESFQRFTELPDTAALISLFVGEYVDRRVGLPPETSC